ncbi:hypothetical protein C0Q70_11376 [Pomacea canaliculata]|uniref:Uncharacterized protein n=1 Tax=Pomacea canaliculata TaxID=400727 RepID=A0A2T7P5U6_POMCA|nr:hypothetical protein C0Q70_11376 [Pomacea canaliculata]
MSTYPDDRKATQLASDFILSCRQQQLSVRYKWQLLSCLTGKAAGRSNPLVKTAEAMCETTSKPQC